MVSLERSGSCGALGAALRMMHNTGGGGGLGGAAGGGGAGLHRRWHSQMARATAGAEKMSAAQRRLKTRSFDCTRSLGVNHTADGLAGIAALLCGAEEESIFMATLAHEAAVASRNAAAGDQADRDEDGDASAPEIDQADLDDPHAGRTLGPRRKSLCVAAAGRRERRLRAHNRRQSAPGAVGEQTARKKAALEAAAAAAATESGRASEAAGHPEQEAVMQPHDAEATAAEVDNAHGFADDGAENMPTTPQKPEQEHQEADSDADSENSEDAPVYTLDPEVERLLEASFLSLQTVAENMTGSCSSPSPAPQNTPHKRSSSKDAKSRKRRHHHRRSASILFKSEESKQREAQLCATLARGGNIFALGDGSPSNSASPVGRVALAAAAADAAPTRASDHWREAGEASQRRRRRKLQQRIENDRAAAGADDVPGSPGSAASFPSTSPSTAPVMSDFIAALVAASNEELQQWSSGDEGMRLATIHESDDSDEDDLNM